MPIPKSVFKSFPTSIFSITRFDKNDNWKMQFVEWDIDPDKLTLNDDGFYFRDANLVFDKYSSRSAELNDSGVLNIFYDNIFTYTSFVVIITHVVIYGIL